jgi:hypothetical protein
MSLSFRNLKRGEIYLLTRERILRESNTGAHRTIPTGAHFLVVDKQVDRRLVSAAYRVLVDGTLGILALCEGDIAPVEGG